AVVEALKHRPGDVRVVIHGERLSGARYEVIRLACEAAAAPLARDDERLKRLRNRSDVDVAAEVITTEETLSEGSDHALLVGASQSGNLGSAIRSLLAFGIEEIALIAPLIDDWSPHVVRASVGL